MIFKKSTIVLLVAMFLGSNAWAVDGVDSETATKASEAEIVGLLWVREEEKLARDSYITLYQRWGLRVFNNISVAEQQHMDSVLVVLNTHGITDPVIDNTVGAFNNPILGDLYDQLMVDGDQSLLDALCVGAFIEEIDIRDIRVSIANSTQADIILLYENLMAGSARHLQAYVTQIEAMGIQYQAQVMDQTEVDAILGRSLMTAQMADGNWMVSGHDGEGMVIDVTVDGIFVMYWMTYDSMGNQVWLLGISDESSEAEITLNMYQYNGPVFGPGFDTRDLVENLWGEVGLHFRDCGTADVQYESVTGYGEGQLEIQRIFYAAGSICQPD